MYSCFSAFITMNLFGQTTNVWIGLQNDDYETWLNGKPVVYSNWSPFDTINVSFKIYFLEITLARYFIQDLFIKAFLFPVFCRYNFILDCH